MANSTNLTQEKQVGLPDSLKKALEKLPAAEAIKIIDDIGKANCDNNNNNNNNGISALHDKIINNVAKLPAEQIKSILEMKE